MADYLPGLREAFSQPHLLPCLPPCKLSFNNKVEGYFMVKHKAVWRRWKQLLSGYWGRGLSMSEY